MDWICGIQNAIDYIEEHLTDEIDYGEVAKQSLSSSYHFQRIFSILCGYTLGEYIRYRRLSLAGTELASGKAKVVDVALKYGYDNPDSFAKAFQKFHGITPSEARTNGQMIKSFSRLSIQVSLKGGSTMNYRIEEKPAMFITGYKTHFSGVPENRLDQQHNLMINGDIRFIRYALQGMAQDCETEYCVVDNINEEGFDFTIGNMISEHFTNNLNRHIGKNAELLTVCKIPRQKYLVAETEQDARAIETHLDIRNRMVTEWFPKSAHCLSKGPEITVYHKPKQNHDATYLEIWLPIEKK